ncbi:MAG: WbqC family protein [bacterium]
MIQTRVTINQPCPFPPMYLFARILSCKYSIILSSAQFTRNSGRSFRHIEIMVSGEKFPLVIPIKHSGDRELTIRDAQIDYSQRWVEKHLKTFQMNYSKTPYFKEIMPVIEEVYNLKPATLAAFSRHSMLLASKYLGVTPQYTLVDCSLMEPLVDSPSKWMMELTKSVNGDVYVCGKSALITYLHTEEFAKNNIQIDSCEFIEPFYTESHEERNLSILDALFRVGPKVKQYLGVNDGQVS